MAPQQPCGPDPPGLEHGLEWLVQVIIAPKHCKYHGQTTSGLQEGSYSHPTLCGQPCDHGHHHLWPAAGPTWPKAAELTNSILDFVTKEFVVGYQGMIIINGDFNFGPHELPCFDIWRAYGFCSAQEYANQRWHQAVAPTCKGATERDLLWMSPTAAALCQKVGVNDVFQDHASVYVQLNIDAMSPTLKSWPRPREIPWSQVEIEEWHQHCEGLGLHDHSDPTQAMKELANSFESSIAGYVQDFRAKTLSPAHCGRAQRLQPTSRKTSSRTCRASRPGEALLVDDLVGQAVILG